MTKTEKCEGCSEPLLPYRRVRLGSIEDGYRELCMACYNTVIAEYSGVNFEHVDFEPIRLTDVDGVGHNFHFNIRLAGDIVVLDAHEMKGEDACGYEFHQ